MQLIPILYQHEHYKCPSCARDLSADDISDSWKCKACMGTVVVYAEDYKGRRQVLNRLSPSELREEFHVVIPGAGFEHVYPVISVTEQNGSFRVALRGYRTMQFTADSLFECVVEAW